MKKKIKICGWCGKEIKDDKYKEIWNEGRLVIIFHTKHFEEEVFRKKFEEILAQGVKH